MHPTLSRRRPVPSLAPGRNAAPAPLVIVRYFQHRPRAAAMIGWACFALLVLLLMTALPAWAQDNTGGAGATVGEPMIAKRQFVGTSARDGAVVRAGASVSDLSVITLSAGQEVVVVGVSGNFLRILPPEGTYCLVPKARVHVRGEAGPGGRKTGRVTENCSVRVGSKINQAIDRTAARLSADEEVTVIGEDSVYYHVVPPKGVFFYVDRNDLLRDREVKVSEAANGWQVAELPVEGAAEPDPAQLPGDPRGTAQRPADSDPATNGESTPPAVTGEGELQNGQAEAAPPQEPQVVAPPTTRPAIMVDFQAVDERYAEAVKLPLEEQPLEELKQQYAALLAKAKADPAGANLVALIEARLQTIDVRQIAHQDRLAMQAMREQMDKRRQALEAEREELAERAEDAKVTVYVAVGQLQPSSLQIGEGALFRLCDPATGRTVIYIRADAEQAKAITRHLEAFVGIKGETVKDEDLDLKYIKVSDVAAVDAKELFKSVAAEIIPPSMVQNAGAAD